MIYLVCKLKHSFFQLLTVLLGLIFVVSLNSVLLADTSITMMDVLSYVKKGEYKKAIPLLRKYNDQNPERVEGLIVLGRIYLAIGGYNNQDLAEKTFQDGLKRDPKNTAILQFLADINKNKQMQENATGYLEKAMSSDPSNSSILEQLMNNYITTGNKEGLKEIQVKVESWVKSHQDSVRGYYNLGQLLLALNKNKEGLQVLKDGLKVNSNYPPIHRALAEAYLLNGNGALCTEVYYYWLSHETDKNILTTEYQLAELSMSDDEQKELKKISFEEKSHYLTKYWRARDPDPISILNERLLEHFYRVAYSKNHFRTVLSPLGFDDRGKVYIRWGPPEEKYSDPMPVLNPSFDNLLADYTNSSLFGEIGGALPSPMSMAIRGNESWAYPSISYYLVFDFVAYGGFYREVRSLIDAFVGAAPGSEASISVAEGQDAYSDWYALQQLYRDRSHISGLYASMGNRSVSAFASEIMHDVPSEKIIAKQTSKPRFSLSTNLIPLDYIVRPAQFRGDSGRTRVDVAYGLNLDQFKPLAHTDSAFTFSFKNTLVFFDTSNMRVLHRQFQQDKAYPLKYDYSKISFSGESVCELLPGDYEMAFQMLETSNKKGQFNQEKIKIKDFLGKDLMISDLKLSPKIDFFGIDEKTGREKLKVMPYPFNQVLQNQQIYVYFEVYNLMLAPDNKSKYEISLKMERETAKGEYATAVIKSFGKIFTKGKAREIETTYMGQGDNQTAIEYILLDVSKLESGRSRLTVTVKDLNVSKEILNSIVFNLQSK